MKKLVTFGVAVTTLAGVGIRTSAQNNGPTFRSESRLVLVDAIVTDKKGAYVGDLTQQEFHVSEDGKDQPIKSFSYEKTPEGKPRQQYTALLFDNRMQPQDEARARDAATKLIAANVGPNRYFAVINFGTILRITQNFTSDQELLLPAIQGKYLGLSGRIASLNSEDVTQVEADFGTGTILQGLRSLAKGMSRIPGRKTVIFITAGFQVPSEQYYELQAAIDACNRANVAVYPLDVRGLVVGAPSAATSRLRVPPRWSDGVYHPDGTVRVTAASFQPAEEPQQAGGPRGGGGGAPTGRVGMLGTYIPDANKGSIRRPPPPVADVTRNMSDPQSVLYALAEGTGGFVIVNTNDIVGGMQKIAQEQTAYYMLGFVPAAAPEGSCHRLKVKVNRSGLLVRSRSTYCTVKPIDLLAGDPVEKQLEAQLEQSGTMTAQTPSQITIAAPFFYTGANTARVNLALDVPSALINMEGGKKELNVLGVAYKNDGSIAARFSDSVTLDKKAIQELKGKPYHYEKQFPIASGEYNLKVVLGSGAETLGKTETELKVESYDSKKLTLSAVALTNELIDLTRNPAIADEAMIEDKKLLVYDGTQFVPSATRRFKRTDETLMYMEVYEPQLVDHPTTGASIKIRYRVLNLDTGATVMDTGLFEPKAAVRPGYPIVPLGLKLLSDRLQPGSYRLVVEAANGAGQVSPARSTDFDVE